MDLHITFELNKKLDKEMAQIFLNRNKKVGGVDFSLGVTGPHPELIKYKDAKNADAISSYLDVYYTEHKDELIDALSKSQKVWEKVESDFIKQIKNIFNKPAVPDGKYIAYLSTLNCNPRFLDNKTFQVFWRHRDGTNLVVAHEVLHFFFYDYAQKKYPNIFADLDMNRGVFWVLAEVFNDVILSTKEMCAIHNKKEFASYPAHKDYTEHLKKVWANDSNIDTWLLNAFTYLQSVLK